MDLTIIGFIIAVVGIILQLADAFPAHRETRQVIVILSIGVFLGMAASAALGARYVITGDVDRRFALLYALAGGAAFFCFLTVIVSDEERRIASGTAALAFGGAFLVSGFFVAMGSIERAKIYSADEILLLAATAEEKGQYEVALERYDELQSRLHDDKGIERIERRIERIRELQAGEPIRPNGI
jgi:hypothetical protein